MALSEVNVNERITQLLDEPPPATTDRGEFWGAQYDLGLAWVSFPEGLGGLGLAPKLQRVVNEELALAKAPNNFARNGIGTGMAAPVIVAYASDELKKRLLRPLFTCEEIWCQLFSEPGAGSDVAGPRPPAPPRRGGGGGGREARGEDPRPARPRRVRGGA